MSQFSRTPFTRTQSKDSFAHRTQQNVLKMITSLFNQVPIINGRLMEDINITTTATAYEHKLGRVPIGWIVLDRGANVTVWRTAWDDKTITLDSTGFTTIRVWIF